MFDLYRLLLQYHDPRLCSFLDSFKIQPEQFNRDWFCSLLSKDMEAELCWTIWQNYFENVRGWVSTSLTFDFLILGRSFSDIFHCLGFHPGGP